MTEICTAVEEELGVALTSRAEAGPLRRLLNDGRLVRYPVLEGVDGLFSTAGSYTYRTPDVDEINLEVILDLARANINPKLELKSGRKSTASAHGSRKVLEVKGAQLAMIETAVRGLVEHLVPSSRPQPKDTPEQKHARHVAGLRAITAHQLVWAEGAGAHGTGDWAILADAEAAFREVEKNSRHRYVGAIRTLLDLAATHGYLLRQEVHGASRTFLPTAWAAALGEWSRLVQQSQHWNRSGGTAQLSRIMAALAELYMHSLEDVDPLRLTQKQSQSFGRFFAARLAADRKISQHHRAATLAMLRALMDVGVMKPVALNQYDRRRTTGRKNAFDCTVYKAIAKEFDMRTRDLSANYGLFRKLGSGKFFDPENPYSLPRLVDWYTLRLAQHRKEKEMGAIDSFPRERVRGSGGLSGRPWSKASLELHLELLGMYLGYVVRYHGVDLNGTVDARHLFTEKLLTGFVDAVHTDGWTTAKRAHDIIYHVSLYCSPCWESAAVAEGEDGAGDADRFQRLADYAAGRGTRSATGWDGLTLHSSQGEVWGLGQDANVETQRLRAEQVQSAYEEAMGEQYAYIAMLRLRNAMIRRYAREMGVDGLVQLRCAIESGNRRLSVNEFVTLRDIRMWADALAAPNRRETIAAMDVSEFRETRNGHLWVEVPARKMKVTRNGDYKLKVGTRGATGDARYRMDLRDAYDVARRQFLRGTQTEVLYVSTQDGREVEDPHRLAAGSITTCFRRILEYGAEELGIDVGPILALNGLASSHAHRHAAASYFVAMNEQELARKMLHHKGMDTLLEVYARGKSDRSPESAMEGVSLPDA